MLGVLRMKMKMRMRMSKKVFGLDDVFGSNFDKFMIERNFLGWYNGGIIF